MKQDWLHRPTPTLSVEEIWSANTRARCVGYARDFVNQCCRAHLGNLPEGSLARSVLPSFVSSGKFLRSAFAYTGWSCGRAGSEAALRAAASLELLHCFALIQDDVMDSSVQRRGRPALHIQLARWHEKSPYGGPAEKFGESAAILFGDLFLVWAEQMLRESGVGDEALSRAWPRYDQMRSELAVGQLSDLVNDARSEPGWESVLDVARRKSGNYTVRRPLEFGASLADCDERGLECLGRYGHLIGETFQFRDDVLGVFGEPATTGKPVADDLRERTATTLMVLARDRANPAQRRTLRALAQVDVVDEDVVCAWRELIVATGARSSIEKMITTRVDDALAAIDVAALPASARHSLRELAQHCTQRSR